ncbi:hypothetical protein [Butyrivibrio sp. INlla21]|uniref:hypothetical protein n=1 Tax=Butyrivibrio sp. INlla21 TaxID=1520811 RepID=UPI0008EC65B2|nr:hypothetical protein [Butyrivibrio sp. INlla21]SFU87174.1 hypothetical protein SAMN02910342_02133 [Butyrivibrio sp. INlla21]
MATIIRETQDLTYLNWAHARNSSGTAGTFLKSSAVIGGYKKYYKLSNFDAGKGVIGHECINEIIVDRLLDIFHIEHLNYELINADIEVDGRIYNTYLCASYDFKERGESKASLDDYYRLNALPGESHYDFCVRMGWRDYIDRMLVVDYLVLNRDRHGANIEILRNSRAQTVRPAPLFDHGLSLLCTCSSDEEAKAFDIMGDKQCNNFIGSRSTFDNLSLLTKESVKLTGILKPKHKKELFEGMDGVLSDVFIDRIWDMIYGRYKVYESLPNIR